MSVRFRLFLTGLSTRINYCLQCLSRMYGESAQMVRQHLHACGIVGRPAHCGSCGEHRETFRGGPGAIQLPIAFSSGF
jgi:hypothetical protein